jgi:hypothetical protein
LSHDLERSLNMLRMNLGPLLFHEASLFQAFGGLSVSVLARLSLLLDALPMLSADKSRLLRLGGITLSESIRFPNAHPLPKQIGAICLTNQFAFEKQIND